MGLKETITAILSNRGKSASFGPPNPTVILQDDADGKGAFIAHWDESLGAPPSIGDGFSADQLRRIVGGRLKRGDELHAESLVKKKSGAP